MLAHIELQICFQGNQINALLKILQKKEVRDQPTSIQAQAVWCIIHTSVSATCAMHYINLEIWSNT